MRQVAALLLFIVLFTANVISVTKPDPKDLINPQLTAPFEKNDVTIIDEKPFSHESESLVNKEKWITGDGSLSRKALEKRRGGGRGGGGGGRSSGSGKGSGSTGAGGSRSNSGGRTTTGSGTPKSIGGYYGGGGAVPYTAGRHSPTGIIPVVLSLSLVSLFFAGAWLYRSVYAYPFEREITYQNATSNKEESLPVLCLCQEFSVCGCDDNSNQAYIDALVVNATAAGSDKDGFITSKITDVNGTVTLVINGTLDNGTTADGGTEVISRAADILGRGVGIVTLAVVVVMGILLM